MILCSVVLFFFFKQKTAYEMRISDWSSDVCSSDLGIAGARQDMAVLMGLNQNGQGITLSNQLREAGVTDGESLQRKIAADPRQYTFAHTFPTGTQIGRASCRERVWQYV